MVKNNKNLNDLKLIIIMGIPGSGKSTLAKKLIAEDVTNKLVIINRDNIRSMLGEYWVPTREHLVTVIETNMIINSIDHGYSVIVDSTNLNPKTIIKFKKLAKSKNIKIKYYILKVSKLKAFFRILYRTILGGRYVSYKVIKSFYERYKTKIGINGIFK